VGRVELEEDHGASLSCALREEEDGKVEEWTARTTSPRWVGPHTWEGKWAAGSWAG
jgi:hypothetical protein